MMAGDGKPKLSPEELASKIARALLAAPVQKKSLAKRKSTAPKKST
jgi:hypothetical protein